MAHARLGMAQISAPIFNIDDRSEGALLTSNGEPTPKRGWGTASNTKSVKAMDRFGAGHPMLVWNAAASRDVAATSISAFGDALRETQQL